MTNTRPSSNRPTWLASAGDRFLELEPVHQWLVELTASAYADEAGEMLMDGLDLKPVVVED